jgi:hypothetical protein
LQGWLAHALINGKQNNGKRIHKGEERVYLPLWRETEEVSGNFSRNIDPASIFYFI